MKMIKPTVLTDAMFTSSTAPEPQATYSYWASGTSYSIGDKAVRAETHRIYESLTNSNLGNTPETSPTDWLDIAPSNQWAMFDDVVGTSTTIASPLTVVIEPGQLGGLALMELVGEQAVITLKDATGGTTVYSKTVDLDGTIITSWYDWFFEDYVQLTDLVLTDLPSNYPNGELTISITGTGDVSCGVCKFGTVLEIGDTMWGATAGIKDYSRKDTDAFGNTVIVERSYAKRNDFKIQMLPADFNKIYRTLASVRATPCVWIGTEVEGYLPLLVYGFYNDFSIDVAYHSMHYCSLEIEGLI
jgi:hypothetical protein